MRSLSLIFGLQLAQAGKLLGYYDPEAITSTAYMTSSVSTKPARHLSKRRDFFVTCWNKCFRTGPTNGSQCMNKCMRVSYSGGCNETGSKIVDRN